MDGNKSLSLDNISDGHVAILVIVVAIIIYYVAVRHCHTRDHFASQRAKDVYNRSQELFSQTGTDTTYSAYKTAVPGPVDSVLYTDVRNLWRKNQLSPETVQQVL